MMSRQETRLLANGDELLMRAFNYLHRHILPVERKREEHWVFFRAKKTGLKSPVLMRHT